MGALVVRFPHGFGSHLHLWSESALMVISQFGWHLTWAVPLPSHTYAGGDLIFLFLWSDFPSTQCPFTLSVSLKGKVGQFLVLLPEPDGLS